MSVVAAATGRHVVPNVPDLFGGIDVRAVGADAAQQQSRESKLDHSSCARREEMMLDAWGQRYVVAHSAVS